MTMCSLPCPINFEASEGRCFRIRIGIRLRAQHVNCRCPATADLLRSGANQQQNCNSEGPDCVVIGSSVAMMSGRAGERDR